MKTNALLVILFAGCLGSAEGPGPGGSDNEDGGTGQTPTDRPVDPAERAPNQSVNGCLLGRSQPGLAGRELTARRITGEAHADRARFKPHAALQREYRRVLGIVPNTSLGNASTFGMPRPRWFSEPTIGATGLYETFRMGLEGCRSYVARPAEFAAAPTDSSASDQCQKLATMLWTRTPDAAEIESCKKVALVATATEQNARERWAFTCASLAASSHFLTY